MMRLRNTGTYLYRTGHLKNTLWNEAGTLHGKCFEEEYRRRISKVLKTTEMTVTQPSIVR
jgi:hypothetical protein